MSDYVWHPQTSRHIRGFITKPSHALLITALQGSGRYTLASELARQLLDLPPGANLHATPAVKLPPSADDKIIPIEFIRELRDFVKLKSASGRTVARVILLPDAERMQVAAQNALLKMLEEPPEDTIIILTAQSERSLLPTIVSRTQVMRLVPPPQTDAVAHFSAKGHEPAHIQRMYMLSGGRIGLMAALLEADSDHPLAGSVQLAKDILQAPIFERLVRVDELAKDKVRCAALLDALEQVLRAALYQAAQADKTPVLRKLHASLERLAQAKAAFAGNVQGKLLLTDLFMNL